MKKQIRFVSHNQSTMFMATFILHLESEDQSFDWQPDHSVRLCAGIGMDQNQTFRHMEMKQYF